MINQHVRLCRADDGTRIAVASTGNGPPLVRACAWFSHIETDRASPVWGHWLNELSRDHTYIRYDPRGSGLSDRTPCSFAFESCVSDLEAVVDTLGLSRFALLGMSRGSAVAIAYAARHPDRVSHLVLLGAYARGRIRRATTAEQREEAEILLKLIRLGWGHNNPAFRQFFTALFIPGAAREQQEWITALERISATPENVAAVVEIFYQIDITALAATVSMPTLICHARHDALVPFDEGRTLAGLIPSARFVPLESQNHILLKEEPAWPHFLSELRSFLGVQNGQFRAPPPLLETAGLTQSELEVLRLIARGLNNNAIAATLGKSEKTVRNQVSAIFSKLGIKSRVEAVVLVKDAEIGGLSE
jgi:pimeloyl-ACP methyl ester carboxylesterase